MFCPECGHKNPEGARFCGACGKDMGAVARTVPSASGGTSAAGVPIRQGATGALRRTPLLVLGAAVVLVVVLVVFGMGRCSKGRGTVEALTDAVQSPYQQMLDDNMSDESVRSFAFAMVDLMPGDAVDALIERDGYDDKEEVVEEVIDSMGASSTVQSMFEKVNAEVEITEGGRLDDDYVDDVNEKLRDDLGLSLEVEEAVALGTRITMTALEDVGGVSAGESVTQETDSSGLVAIKVDGQWYLWVSSMNW